MILILLHDTLTTSIISRQSVYMIDWCPEETSPPLSAMCGRHVPREDYTFLHDLPTQSAVSGIVYNNVFCALCHHDHHRLQDLDAIVQCIVDDVVRLPPTDHGLFLTMDYHPGHLRWTTTLTRHLLTEYFNSTFDEYVNKTVECEMYLNIKGQFCEQVEKRCADGWPDDDTRRSCASYTYHVYTKGKTFKNWDCAVCHNVPLSDIKCSPHNAIFYSTCHFPPSSVNDIFQVYGDCQEPQVWNPLSRKCETISCGSLYKLVDGECVRDDSQITGRFSINSSCFTREYNRNLSLIFPNLTIYLNETETAYNRGEYEFVDENVIRVCRPPDTIPVLQIVSTILMLISLVCMSLHMCIFLVQWRRSSVPRLTHFLMVLSLFIAELLLLLTFNANEDYAACVVYGSITYYFFSVAFFWMNVISFDICRAFCSQTYGRATIKTFLCYFAYATVVPLAMSTTAVVVDQLVPRDFVLHPNFGTDRCWFNNKWGLVAFFMCPVFFILIINLFLYIISVCAIHKQQKLAEFASRSVIKNYRSVYELKLNNRRNTDGCEQSSSCSGATKCASPLGASLGGPEELSVSCGYLERKQERTRLKVVRERLVIYSKVALIMGMTWVFALVYVFVESPVAACLNVIFNCLQGTFIFIAFDCTREKRKKLWITLSSYTSKEKCTEAS